MVNSLATRSAASQVSSSILILRSTSVVPPRRGPSLIHTARSRSAGLTVPSTWPIRLRLTVPEDCRKPRWVQRTRVKERASLTIMRRAWDTVRLSSAQICTSRSPPLHRFWSRSVVKAGSAFTGESSPAALNRPGPNPKVTVSRAGVSASSGSVSASAGRPWVRRRASSVSSRNSRTIASLRVVSSRSNPTKTACVCGVVAIPAWWSPSNGSMSGVRVAAPPEACSEGTPPARAPTAVAAPPASRPRRLIRGATISRCPRPSSCRAGSPPCRRRSPCRPR